MKNTEDPPKVRRRITAKDIQNIIASESQSEPTTQTSVSQSEPTTQTVRRRITAEDIQNIIAESQSKPSGGGTDVNFIPASSGQSGGGTMEQSEEQKKDGKPSWNKFPWEGLQIQQK